MRTFSTSRLGIEQGETILFSDFDVDGVMWTGDGTRQARVRVDLPSGFVEAPMVTVGLSMWDMSNDANARADVKTEDVDKDGFTIVFRTWSDTRVARVRVSWQAIGPVRDDDDWDL